MTRLILTFFLTSHVLSEEVSGNVDSEITSELTSVGIWKGNKDYEFRITVCIGILKSLY